MSLKRRIDRLEEEAGPERCDNCREWNEWVVRYEGSGEPNPTPCQGVAFSKTLS